MDLKALGKLRDGSFKSVSVFSTVQPSKTGISGPEFSSEIQKYFFHSSRSYRWKVAASNPSASNLVFFLCAFFVLRFTAGLM